MSSNPAPPAQQARLGEVIARKRATMVDRLAQLEWAADPSNPRHLVRDPEQVRPRAELFVDALVSGLRSGDWRSFDEAIASRSVDLLRAGVVTAADLDRRSLTLASFLIPVVLEEPDPAPLIAALFGTMQALSGGIISAYNQRLLEDSRRLDDLKTLFLRMAGHELRAPLGNIRGYASMLREGDFGELPAGTQRAVDAIDSAAARGLSMLDRVGEVARLESGAEALHRKRHRLAAVVAAAIEPLRRAASVRGVRLDIHATEEEAMFDAGEVEIAIRNLLGNALKYAASGGVVSVRAWRDGWDVWFEVADRGPGIPPEEMGRLFERYHRSDTSGGGKIAGSGLGLYIVKRIAELHGGEATAESVPGAGSTFRVRLPAQVPSAP